jgi:uracil-DNA glycosylase
MHKTLPRLLKDIRACTHCADALPCGPRPVLQAHRSARLCIVGQAPSRKVHETGVPWNDASGDRLREWLGLTREQFYDPRKTAIIPMGFCYPGKAVSGDNPPRPECAPRWHEKLNANLPNIALTLLIGRYARLLISAVAARPRSSKPCGHGRSICRWAICRWRTPRRVISHGLQWFEEELVRELRSVVQTLKL